MSVIAKAAAISRKKNFRFIGVILPMFSFNLMVDIHKNSEKKKRLTAKLSTAIQI